jgi:hypothetical protein
MCMSCKLYSKICWSLRSLWVPKNKQRCHDKNLKNMLIRSLSAARRCDQVCAAGLIWLPSIELLYWDVLKARIASKFIRCNSHRHTRNWSLKTPQRSGAVHAFQMTTAAQSWFFENHAHNEATRGNRSAWLQCVLFCRGRLLLFLTPVRCLRCECDPQRSWKQVFMPQAAAPRVCGGLRLKLLKRSATRHIHGLDARMRLNTNYPT